MRQLFFSLFLAFFAPFLLNAQTIVERHGQLKVDGKYIKDKCDRIAQLKGMSYFWHQWEGSEFWNADAVKWMRDDWKVEIVRAVMGVRYNSGDCCDYFGNPTASKNKVKAVVNAAIQHGIYVIIDWHSHDLLTNDAKTFFAEMAQEFGSYPNVIYEIYNEPTGSSWTSLDQTWPQLKQYSRELIATIRQYDPDNLIIVPTPFYDQFVHQAADDKLTVDINNNPVGNVAYCLHIYADAHRFDAQQGDWAKDALSKNLPMFVTESGATGTNYNQPRSTGLNAPNYTEWNKWETWWDQNGISFCKWSLSTKDEFGSSLLPGAPSTGNWNYNTHLTDEGRWNRDHFRAVNTLPSACPASSPDDIISTTTPTSVTVGSTVNVTVNYSASTNRDIIVVFQLDSNPYTIYSSTKVDVTAGSNKSVVVSVPVPGNTPIANDAYQIQTFITTDGGAWNQRLDNLAKTDIDATAGSSSGTTRYEAENAALTGMNTSTGYSGYSGTGYATGMDANGDKVTFTVNVPSTGSYSLKIRYSVCNTQNNYVVINGTSTNRVFNDGIANCGGWETLSFNVSLNSGNNTIAIQKNWGWTEIDYIEVGPASANMVINQGLNGRPRLNDAMAFRVYPNPIEGENEFTVAFDGMEEEVVDLNIFDMAGKNIYCLKNQSSLGLLNISGDIFRNSGLYVLRASSPTNSKTVKLVVKKE
jgi:Cellulase (glycosyl hydrolase family 5)/Carbohydrate binding module (family 35)/Secretion system C-terminal sorting domain